MLRFENQVRAAIRAMGEWGAHDVESVVRAADLYEEVVNRAPRELATLSELPRPEGLNLWLELASLGQHAGSKLLEVTFSGRPMDGEARSRMRQAVQRVQKATQALLQITSARAREVRSESTITER